MPNTLSVVHLVAPAEVGGLESVVQLLARGQRARGHDVQVLAVLPHAAASAPWVRALRDGAVPVTPVVSPGRRYLAEWRTLRDAVVRLRPDIVHTHGYRVDVLGGDAARRAGAPTVATVHGFTGGDWKNRVYEGLQCRAFRGFDAVVAVSRPMRALLHERGVRDERLHVVPNALGSAAEPLDRAAARAQLGIPADEFCVGWVGRLSREKGADVMIAALAERGAGDVTLGIVGDGQEQARLRSDARRLGVEDRIRWLGVRPDAGRLLRAFDAVVLSSRTEGTPMVLLEAMAAGVPVVAARVGGIPDVVDETEALLVPSESPGAIAAALAQLRAAPAEGAARAARAAARLRERHAVEPWLSAYDDVYAGVLARRQGARG